MVHRARDLPTVSSTSIVADSWRGSDMIALNSSAMGFKHNV
jgi:hypothetical protein